MSIMKYIESNTWSYVLICLDFLLVFFGVVIQRLFPNKEKMIILILSCMVILFCIIGNIVLNSGTLTRWPYIMGYLAFGIAFFEIGAIISILNNRRRGEK